MSEYEFDRVLLNASCLIDIAAALIAIGMFSQWFSPMAQTEFVNLSGSYFALGSIGIAFGVATLVLSIPLFCLSAFAVILYGVVCWVIHVS